MGINFHNSHACDEKQIANPHVDSKRPADFSSVLPMEELEKKILPKNNQNPPKLSLGKIDQKGVLSMIFRHLSIWESLNILHDINKASRTRMLPYQNDIYRKKSFLLTVDDITKYPEPSSMRDCDEVLLNIDIDMTQKQICDFIEYCNKYKKIVNIQFPKTFDPELLEKQYEYIKSLLNDKSEIVGYKNVCFLPASYDNFEIFDVKHFFRKIILEKQHKTLNFITNTLSRETLYQKKQPHVLEQFYDVFCSDVYSTDDDGDILSFALAEATQECADTIVAAFDFIKLTRKDFLEKYIYENKYHILNAIISEGGGNVLDCFVDLLDFIDLNLFQKILESNDDKGSSLFCILFSDSNLFMTERLYFYANKIPDFLRKQFEYRNAEGCTLLIYYIKEMDFFGTRKSCLILDKMQHSGEDFLKKQLAMRDRKGFTALYYAVVQRYGIFYELMDLIESFGNDYLKDQLQNPVDNEDTLLMVAAQYGDYDIIVKIINGIESLGEDFLRQQLEARGSQGKTPLECAKTAEIRTLISCVQRGFNFDL